MYAHHMPGQGQFQSTHPARGATLRRRPVLPSQAISIHAPREGCDLAYLFSRWPPGNFNPRTPRGVRLSAPMSTALLCHFNPRTPRGVRLPLIPSQRAAIRNFNPRTPRGVRPLRRVRRPAPRGDFNPRTPRGVRLQAGFQLVQALVISIHAPREGCDPQSDPGIRSR